jgi:hypothetical protein
VLHQVSLIVVGMVGLTLCGVLLCWLRGRLPSSRRWWLPLAVVPVGVLMLQLPVSHPVWILLPKLRYLQFPWRWLVALEAPMGVFLAAAVWPQKGRWQRWLVGAVAATAFAGCMLHARQEYFQACSDQDSVAGSLAAWNSGQGFRGMDEYVPPGADNGLVSAGLPDACLVSDPLAQLGVDQPPPPDAAPDDDLPPPMWQPAQASCMRVFSFDQQQINHGAEHRGLRAEMAQPGYLVLKLHRYPAWTVRVNGRLMNGDRANALPRRADGLLVVPVPAGPVELAVDWTATPDVLLGRWVSAASVLLLTGLVFFERRKRRLR